MRMSDWSSDVCSSDLKAGRRPPRGRVRPHQLAQQGEFFGGRRRAADDAYLFGAELFAHGIETTQDHLQRVGTGENGRASGRERVRKYVMIQVGAVSLKKQKLNIISNVQYTKSK